MRAMLPALLLAPALALADAPADYAYSAPITLSAATPFHRVELPATVYRVLTHADLRDLRVFNAAGEVVPHAIEPRPSLQERKADPVEVPLFALPEPTRESSALGVRVEKRGDGTIVSVTGDTHAPDAPPAYLLDVSRLEQAVGALQLVPADATAQFVGRVRVEASDDLDRWRTLAGNAPLLVTGAGGQSLSRLRVEWPASRFKYLRIGWVGGPAVRAVRFARASVEPAPASVETTRSWERIEPLPAKLDEVDYAYTLPVGAPIDRLRLHLPQVNSVVAVTLMTRSRSEDPWRPLTSRSVYRLQQDGVEFESPDIVVSPARQLLVRIDRRGGGLGSGAPTLEAGWIAHAIVFAGRGAGPYRLGFGSAGADQAAFPIAALVPDYRDGRDDSLRRLIGAATLGQAAGAGGETRLRAQVDIKRWALWGVLLAAVVLLGVMAWRLWRQLAPPEQDSDKR